MDNLDSNTDVGPLDSKSGEAAVIWPPPPSAPCPEIREPYYDGTVAYTPIKNLSRWVVTFLKLEGALLVACMFLAAMHTGPSAPIYQLTQHASLAVSAIASILFLRWTYIAYRNLRAFHVIGLRHSPGKAVGYFFVPGLALYKPYSIFIEIWKGSDPDTNRSQSIATTFASDAAQVVFCSVMWGIGTLLLSADFIATAVQVSKGVRAVGLPTVEYYNSLATIGYVFGTIFLVKEIDRRQDKTHALMTSENDDG